MKSDFFRDDGIIAQDNVVAMDGEDAPMKHGISIIADNCEVILLLDEMIECLEYYGFEVKSPDHEADT